MKQYVKEHKQFVLETNKWTNKKQPDQEGEAKEMKVLKLESTGNLGR